MRAFQRLFCLFGVHRRSRGSVIHFPDAPRSVCRACRVPMIKDATGWQVDPSPLPALPPSPFG